MKPIDLIKFTVAITALAIISISCGGSGALDGDVILSASEGSTAPTSSTWHNLLNSKSYSGQIAVMFKDGTDVRLSDDIEKSGPFISKAETTALTNINIRFRNRLTPALDQLQIPVNAIRRGVPELTEEEIDQAVENASNAGVNLYDWNLFYKIDVKDPSKALQLIEELKKDPAIKYIYPVILPELADVGSTQGYFDQQGYLDAVTGLNIRAGWEAGATGEGVVIADEEVNWNCDHEDLPIDCDMSVFPPDEVSADDDRIYTPYGGMQLPGYTDSKYVQHGTATVGVLAGLHNNIGIDGIVPNSTVKLIPDDGATGGPIYGIIHNALRTWLDDNGRTDRMRPGDVIVIEVQYPGPTTTTGCSVGDSPSDEGTGCVPVEAQPAPYQAIKDAISSGYIIVEAGGNGSLDLASSEARFQDCGSDPCPDYANESSGAIMIGASEGANRAKASWSNCGTRVNSFAWGLGVVSSGYGDLDNGVVDSNKWYTKTFSGTSSATAIMGGVVAQIQSYVKKKFEHDGVYLNAQQMIDLLNASGQAQTDASTCKIGTQPDVGAAIEMIDDWEIPNVTELPVHPINETVISGIRYDMDTDGKADLISFSRNRMWYVDLSNEGCDSGEVAPCFGTWDISGLVIQATDANDDFKSDSMLFPVVADYNSDGRADLALYDSKYGKWYIKYTTTHVIASSQGTVIYWDRVINYSGEENWKPYSRPLVADFNKDKFVDISLATPDGNWVVDYGSFNGIKLISGDVEYSDKFGEFENSIPYLSSAQALPAPDWAWLPNIFKGSGDLEFDAPDGITVTKNVSFIASNWVSFKEYLLNDSYIFGNGSYYFTYSKGNGGARDSIGVKNNAGSISLYTASGTFEKTINGFDDILCRPVPADYDGDLYDDIAVQCGNTWKIIYSTDNLLKEYNLGQALDPLPGIVYAGGIKYQDILSIFGYEEYKTQLPCNNGQLCTSGSEISDVQPPIGPYFAECLKYWAPDPAYCWDK